jgi:membrane protease subunit HflK
MDRDVIDISKVQLPNIPPRLILIGVVAIVGLLLAFNSFYQVQPEEFGMIRRFGKYVGPPTQPGLRFKLPFIDVVDKVPVQRQLKVEFGFRTLEAGVRKVHIIDGRLRHSLLLEIFTTGGVGTEIVHESGG